MNKLNKCEWVEEYKDRQDDEVNEGWRFILACSADCKDIEDECQPRNYAGNATEDKWDPAAIARLFILLLQPTKENHWSVNTKDRNQSGDIKARLAVFSANGGANWDTSYFDNQLPDPVCQGSILNIGIKNKKNILAFSNAADTLRRDNLTLRISFDEGITWAKQIPIDKSPIDGTKDFTAYSDLVKMRNNKIGVLYEKEGYAKIVFKVINWKK